MSSRVAKVRAQLGGIVVLLLAACTSVSTQTYTATPARATLPPIVFSATITPTPRPTMIPPPTWEPLPTLSPEEANEMVRELLQTNAGCKLPCWWGITPGETDVQTALQFLETFAINIDQRIGGMVIGGDGVPFLSSYYHVEYHIPGEFDESVLRIQFRDNIVVDITANSRYFSVSQILSDYGAPPHILLELSVNCIHCTHQEIHVDDFSSVTLMIVYPKQGVHVSYTDREFNRDEEQDIMRPCFSKDEAHLHLTSPDPDRVYLGPFNISLTRDIYVVTDIDIQAFYETFKNPETEPCFDIWLDRYDLLN